VSDIQHRIDLTVGWLINHVADGPEGTRGWGWVPDVPANPQNTAEVVCVLAELDRQLLDLRPAERLIRSNHVMRSTGSSWRFEEVIDTAWRLRALRSLGQDDDDVRMATDLLLTRQDLGGGWRMGAAAGSVSTTATRTALLALAADPCPAAGLKEAMRAGVQMLVSYALDAPRTAGNLYSFAQIADILSRPELRELGAPRADRAHDICLRRIREALMRQDLPVEEEIFIRAGFKDTWRHTSLTLGLTALARSDINSVFLPEFRRGMAHFLDLQETEPDCFHLGGFRTSTEGFVTSYATTQALEMLRLVADSVLQRVNPARAFDYICSTDGAHHSDPRDLLSFSHYRVTMNSTAGGLTLLLCVSSGATILTLALELRNHMPAAEGRALVIWGVALLSFGGYVYAALRLPRTANKVVAAVSFSFFTALALPIVTYLLS
jgi:hypothetical protein